MPKITIYIPLSPVGPFFVPFINPCLESISAQSFSDFQVLMLSGGDIGEAMDIFRRHAAKDPRFQCLTYEGRPPDFLFKRAFFQAVGSEFFMPTGWLWKWERELLADHLQAMAASPEAILSYHLCRFIDKGGRSLHHEMGRSEEPYGGEPDLEIADPAERFIRLWGYFKFHPATNGMLRMNSVLLNRVPLHSLTWPAAYTRWLWPLSLAAPLVRINRVLSSYVLMDPMAAHWLSSELARPLLGDHSPALAGARALYSPLDYLRSGLAVAHGSSLPPEVKNSLLAKMPGLFLAAWGDQPILLYLRTLYHDISIVYDKLKSASEQDFMALHRLLVRLNDISYWKNIFPRKAGLDRALALCRLGLEQNSEARASFEEMMGKIQQIIKTQQRALEADPSGADLAEGLSRFSF